MNHQTKKAKNDYKLRSNPRQNKPGKEDLVNLGVAVDSDTSGNTSTYCSPRSASAESSPSAELQRSDPPLSMQFDVFKQELKGMLCSLNKDMNDRFDHVLRELSGFKRELECVKSSVVDITASLSDTSERVGQLESDKIPKLYEQLKKTEKEIDEKLLKLEIHDRKLNLLVYGLAPTPNENVYETLIKVFMNLLNISRDVAQKIQLVNAHRLPSSRNSIAAAPHSNAPPAIIVRFVKMADRDRVLQAFEQPRHASESQDRESPPQRIAIRSDLPPIMKRERGRLAAAAYTLRKTQHLATSIRVVGSRVVLFTRKRSNNGEPPARWVEWKE